LQLNKILRIFQIKDGGGLLWSKPSAEIPHYSLVYLSSELCFSGNLGWIRKRSENQSGKRSALVSLLQYARRLAKAGVIRKSTIANVPIFDGADIAGNAKTSNGLST